MRKFFKTYNYDNTKTSSSNAKKN